MQDLFTIIEKKGIQDGDRLFTVIEGNNTGEKALFHKEEILWESISDGFFFEHHSQIASIEKTGIYIIGEKQIFCDALSQEKELIICGGGHVSIPVIKLGLMLGFQVTVLEDRPEFATNAQQAGANKVILDSFDQGLACIPGNKNTYFVIVTRGHRYDYLCLQEIAKKQYAYIGMIGSRRRVALVKKQLLEAGTNSKALDELHSPIGLDIGGETPEEIAVSIMAEIIQEKNKKNHSCGFSKKILQGIRMEEVPFGHKVLCTIIKRKGSAPQSVGTKMLVLPDGRTVGTIGGGCMEAEVKKEALKQARCSDRIVRIVQSDLTGKDAMEDGMVCGGKVDVLLETIV